MTSHSIKPTTRIGECGIRDDGKLHFPLFLMGACGSDDCVVKTLAFKVPEKLDKLFFQEIAYVIMLYPMFDWDWLSFKKNVVDPNTEHIAQVMNLGNVAKDRLCDLYVVLNNWFTESEKIEQNFKEKYEKDHDHEEETELVLINHETFFSEVALEF